MKKLRYKTKKEFDLSIEDMPTGFTKDHTYEYEFKKGKLKSKKIKLKPKDIQKIMK